MNELSSQPLQSLLTQNPEEGFALAVKLAQKGVEITQPSEEIRKVLRPTYSRDADSLTAASQVIAIVLPHSYCNMPPYIKAHNTVAKNATIH